MITNIDVGTQNTLWTNNEKIYYIVKELINKNSEFLHEMEINQLQRLIDYLDIVKTPHSDSFELPKLRKDFKRFYEQYDQRRNKDFVSTFPSLADWYTSL